MYYIQNRRLKSNGSQHSKLINVCGERNVNCRDLITIHKIHIELPCQTSHIGIIIRSKRKKKCEVYILHLLKFGLICDYLYQ